MQKHLKISINGKQYSIATDEHDQDIYYAAELVDTLLKNKIEKMPPNSEDKAVLAVALHLATDLTKSNHMLKACEQKIAELVVLIDEM